MTFPAIIQGGMGVGVSGWRLARAVCAQGQLGVVSGTALDAVLARRLQLGDPGGELRGALAALPIPGVAERIIDRYYIEGGKDADRPFRAKPMIDQRASRAAQELLVAAGFVEVYLAKQGHRGPVGINFLQKIQTPTLPTLYGAILAGVGVVIVGAGIPLEFPGLIDRLSQGLPAQTHLHMRTGAGAGPGPTLEFDPAAVTGLAPTALRHPAFMPIVASVTLAAMMVRKCPGQIDGLIIEAPSAGGHNAPPRGPARRNHRGEPVYGPRDVVDLDAIRKLNTPFWLAGANASPQRLKQALAEGASGVQVGSAFAFCEESGLRDDLKRRAIEQVQRGDADVLKDPLASPTGFPFQVLSMSGTLSEHAVYEARERTCDLGYLREAYERPDGALGWRCPAEDTATYEAKGGDPTQTIGRKCLCNGLMANIGLAQVRGHNRQEPPLITCGDDLSAIGELTRGGRTTYRAAEVIAYLLEGRAVA